MSVVRINKNNFEEIINGKAPVLLDFYADRCPACRSADIFIEKIAAGRGDVVVGKINVDEERELAAEFGVSSIPTFVVIKNGRVAARATGARPLSQILSLIENNDPMT